MSERKIVLVSSSKPEDVESGIERRLKEAGHDWQIISVQVTPYMSEGIASRPSNSFLATVLLEK